MLIPPGRYKNPASCDTVKIQALLAHINGENMKNLSVDISEYPPDKSITLLTVKGYIDTTTGPEFEKSFRSALGAKITKMMIDLRDVDYISSAGWGVFISEIRKIREQKGDLVLVGMKPSVLDVFEMLQFNSILKSFPTLISAVKKSFGNS